jgi:hypothetical protein
MGAGCLNFFLFFFLFFFFSSFFITFFSKVKKMSEENESTKKRKRKTAETDKVKKGNYCRHEGCTTTAAYNSLGETRGIFCAKHKDPEMINVISKCCAFEGCLTRPAFNHPGTKGGKYCFAHKEPGMKNVIGEKCTHKEGCTSGNPSFNYPGIKTGILCGKHKLPGMINVKCKHCIVEGCFVEAYFNHLGETMGKFCAEHKEPGMENVKTRRCAAAGCRLRPLYNHYGEITPKYCDQHKEPYMEDVKHKKCANEGCETRKSENPMYEKYCLRCFVHLFPNKPVATQFKCRENEVLSTVMDAFPEFTWRREKRIECSAFNRRPDALVDFGTHALVVEVDEDQHKRYDSSCENKRMMQIWTSLQEFRTTVNKETGDVSLFQEEEEEKEGERKAAERPVVFIRFNPDSYVDAHGKKEKSCWTHHPKTGLWYVASKNREKWDAKMQCLKDTVEYWSEHVPNGTIKIVPLFFSAHN